MTAKEYLQQYREAVRRADAAIRHRDALREMAERITPNYGGSGGGTHAAGDRLGETVAKIIDAETRIDAEISMLIATQREVGQVIDSVPNSVHRELLTLVYINGNTLAQAVDLMNYSYRQITRMHGYALQKVGQILAQSAQNCDSDLFLDSPAK